MFDVAIILCVMCRICLLVALLFSLADFASAGVVFVSDSSPEIVDTSSSSSQIPLNQSSDHLVQDAGEKMSIDDKSEGMAWVVALPVSKFDYLVPRASRSRLCYNKVHTLQSNEIPIRPV